MSERQWGGRGFESRWSVVPTAGDATNLTRPSLEVVQDQEVQFCTTGAVGGERRRGVTGCVRAGGRGAGLRLMCCCNTRWGCRRAPTLLQLRVLLGPLLVGPIILLLRLSRRRRSIVVHSRHSQNEWRCSADSQSNQSGAQRRPRQTSKQPFRNPWGTPTCTALCLSLSLWVSSPKRARTTCHPLSASLITTTTTTQKRTPPTATRAMELLPVFAALCLALFLYRLVNAWRTVPGAELKGEAVLITGCGTFICSRCKNSSQPLPTTAL